MNKNLGVFPTMITPYTRDNQVDYQGVEALVEWYWKKGCDGIFAVCQSSEILYLSLQERVAIAKCVVEKAKRLAAQDTSRAPMRIIVSGHVSDTFDDQVEELNALAATGTDALILISNRLDIENTSEDKWIEDLHKLMARLPADMPLGVYECPKPYKRLLTPKMLKACKDTGRFAFIKDTCCDAQTLKERADILANSDLGLYNANAQTYLESIRGGADGYCGVMANFHPEVYSWLFRNQNDEKAELVQAALCMAAFTECFAYPATAKYYLKEYEGLDINAFSRAVDERLITDYQKSCLRQMKTLIDCVKAQCNIN